MGNSHQNGMCYDDQEQQPLNQWCSYEATDYKSIKVQIIFMALLLIIGAVILRYLIKVICYRRDNQYSKLFGNVFTYIFALVIGWFICTTLWIVGSFTKTLINIIIFYSEIRKDLDQPIIPTPVHMPGDTIVILASVFTFFDFMATYFVLFTVLFIPYQWVCIGLNSVKLKQDELSFEDRRFIEKRGFKVLKIVKIFMKYFQSILPIFLIVQPFLLFFTKFGCKSNLILYNVFFVIVDSFMVLVFYVYGYCLSKWLAQRNLIKMKKSDYARIKCEYVLLASVTLMRIVLNIFFRVFNTLKSKTSHPSNNCGFQDSEQNKSQIFNTILFLSLAHSFMHLLPISVVLYVYRPNIEQKIRDYSLLDNQLNSKSKGLTSNSDSTMRTN